MLTPKKNWRLNLITLLFIIVSFISVTLAWFAYSGLANMATEIDIKAWYIELEKDGEMINSQMVITLSDIYPGMDTVQEIVDIKNLGDSDAQVNYKIITARLLDQPEDNYIVDDNAVYSETVIDALAHNYPFKINFNLTKNYALAKGDSSIFTVSVSWPLDSASDELDSMWGLAAYNFKEDEKAKQEGGTYEIRPALQIVVNLIAEQYIETEISSDVRFNLGDVVFYDVINNESCSKVSSTCLKTYIIDVNNTLAEDTVTLLLDPLNYGLSSTYNAYNETLETLTSDWTVPVRSLLISDLLPVISTDIINSVLWRPQLSPVIIGNLTAPNRLTLELNKAISGAGEYHFQLATFPFLNSNSCYWTSSEYNTTKMWAVGPFTEEQMQITGLEYLTNCQVIPVLKANKEKIS